MKRKISGIDQFLGCPKDDMSSVSWLLFYTKAKGRHFLRELHCCSEKPD
jgi:hypothetical protein